MKRYSPTLKINKNNIVRGGMVENEEGSWVRFEDVKRMLDIILADVKEIKGAVTGAKKGG